jgi:hypothetical protein
MRGAYTRVAQGWHTGGLYGASIEWDPGCRFRCSRIGSLMSANPCWRDQTRCNSEEVVNPANQDEGKKEGDDGLFSGVVSSRFWPSSGSVDRMPRTSTCHLLSRCCFTSLMLLT